MIRHNLRYKVLALASALALYFMYGRTDEKPLTSAVVRVQVRAVNVPDGLEITTQPVISVSIQGPKHAIDELLNRPDGGASELDATVDLAGKGVGPHMLPVKVNLRKPLMLVPGQLYATVTLEAIVERTLPVEVVPQGSVAPGYRWESTSANPASITIVGARSAVEQVARVEARVPVRGATGDLDRDVPLRALDSRDEVVEHIDVRPSLVSVHVRISRLLRYKVAPIVLQTTGRPANGYRISTVIVEPLVVTVSGSSQALESVQAVSTEPVDLAGATAPIIRRVRLAPPEGIETVSASAARVKVFLINEAVGTP